MSNQKGTNVDISVPSPSERQMTAVEAEFFYFAQTLMRKAMTDLGRDTGISVVMSGLTRELRRHMPVEACQEVLRGLADTMPAASKMDVPDKPQKEGAA